jgi:small neutral amino acid transporter SnatA (MarC family)
MSVLAAVNPSRVAVALSLTPQRERIRPLVAAVVVAAGVFVVLYAAAGWLLDVLDVTDETWRIAAGAVAVLSGARHLALRAAMPVPRLTVPIHAVAPVAFPLLLVPEVVVLAVLYGATESVGTVLAASAAGLGAAALWGAVTAGPVTRGAVRMFAALLIVAGVALLVMGIRDV